MCKPSFIHLYRCLRLFKFDLSAGLSNPVPSGKINWEPVLKQSQQGSKGGMPTKPEKRHHQRIENTGLKVFWQVKVKMRA